MDAWAPPAGSTGTAGSYGDPGARSIRFLRSKPRGGRTHYETRATFKSLAMAGGAPRAELDLITHPSPREAADLSTRLEVVWPAMCRAVLAVQLDPQRPAGVEGAEDVRSQQIAVPDPETGKARRFETFGPSREVGAAGFEPATPAV